MFSSCHGGHDFAATDGGEVGENEVHKSSANVGKGVAVEEQKGRAPMALAQEVYGFGEGVGFGLLLPPLCFKRSIAL